MAMKASATVMITSGESQRLLGEDEALFHGGDLGAARRLFPGAPEPFIDLSTGINPYPYPVPRVAAELFARLPAPADVQALARAAARAYGAPSEAHVVPVPGHTNCAAHRRAARLPDIKSKRCPAWTIAAMPRS